MRGRDYQTGVSWGKFLSAATSLQQQCQIIKKKGSINSSTLNFDFGPKLEFRHITVNFKNGGAQCRLAITRSTSLNYKRHRQLCHLAATTTVSGSDYTTNGTAIIG